MLLFLNDIAGSEILLILVFILIFFGSKSIPGIARTMGRTMRQLKDASQEVQNEIKKSGMDIKKDMNLRSIMDQTESDIRQPLDQYASDINEALNMDARPYQKPPVPASFPEEKPMDERFAEQAKKEEYGEKTESPSSIVEPTPEPKVEATKKTEDNTNEESK